MLSPDGDHKKDLSGIELKILNLDQIRRIDSLLALPGDYGEIHLIVQHGELRYINKVKSYRAWNDNDKKRDGEQATPRGINRACRPGSLDLGTPLSEEGNGQCA
jgi:hypothetical protein